MPDSSSGNHTLPPGYLAVTGQAIQASQHNPPLEDLSASMSLRYMRDGRAPLLGNIQMNGYRATGAGNAEGAQDLVTLSQVQALIAAVAGVPPGALIPLTGSIVPPSWVVANGQTLVRATYPNFWTWVQASGNLAATEGAKTVGQYGPGDGSTTFTVPNLYADNGYFIRPISSGRNIGSVQADDNKVHSHGVSDPGHQHGYVDTIGGTGLSGWSGAPPLEWGNQSTVKNTNAGVTNITIQNSGGNEARPKNIAYPVIIKT